MRVRTIGKPVDRLRALRLQWSYRRLAGPRLLRAFASAYPKAFFIEIGANDGERGSALSEFIRSAEWRGIMVEPAPHVFGRLRENYGGLGRLALENAAISERDGRLPFYHLAEGPEFEQDADDWRESTAWLQSIGSLSRAQVLSHAPFVSSIEKRIMITEVDSLTLSSLCRRHDVKRIDLLFVDAEGFDDLILRQVDFEGMRPRMIVYEHLHLTEARRHLCKAMLEDAGYELMEEFFDTHCVDTRIDDRLTREFRRFRPRLAPVYADAQADTVADLHHGC